VNADKYALFDSSRTTRIVIANNTVWPAASAPLFQVTSVAVQPVLGFVTDQKAVALSMVAGMLPLYQGWSGCMRGAATQWVLGFGGYGRARFAVFHPEATRMAAMRQRHQPGAPAQAIFQIGACRIRDWPLLAR